MVDFGFTFADRSKYCKKSIAILVVSIANNCEYSSNTSSNSVWRHYCYTATTTILWLSGFCRGLPVWAGTRKVKPGKQNQSGFTWASDSEWQWHQLGHMQICTLPQRDNHASIPQLSFLQVGCPSCCPTNSVKALKAVC